MARLRKIGFRKLARLIPGSLALLMVSSSLAGQEAGPTIRFVEESGFFELEPLPGDLSERLNSGVDPGNVFALRVVADHPKRPDVAGSYTWPTAKTLRFVPRFSLVPGLSYEARFLPGGFPDALRNPAWQPQSKIFTVAALEKRPPAEVTAIYPTANQLPENLLKFYLHFSMPMSRGEAYEKVELLDSKGVNIPLPFLELGEELWDREQRRLTLFFDPGRVKRGLKPNHEVGRPLLSGNRYTLVVKSSWKDAQRRQLAQTYKKTFTVIDADYTQPALENWEFELPAAGTMNVLRVKFQESLDHALLDRVLRVVDAEGLAVPGTATVGPQETTWTWKPNMQWKTGIHSLVADPVLEDLAGNSLDRPFEEIESNQDPFSAHRKSKPTQRIFELSP